MGSELWVLSGSNGGIMTTKLTPKDSETEIIRHRGERASAKDTIAAMNKGGFKTASGMEWTVVNLRNVISRMALQGRLVGNIRDAHSAAGVKAAKTRAKNAKTNKVSPIKTMIATLNGGKPGKYYVTALVRIPVEISIGSTEFHVQSLEK